MPALFRPTRHPRLRARRVTAAVAAVAIGARAQPPATGTIAIVGATVVPLDDSAPRGPVTLLVRDGRIARIGAGLAVPRGARVIDGRGRWLIPGLWDMHVHLWGETPYLDAFAAQGVTGVRDMGTDPARLARWRRATDGRPRPRIVSPGPMLAGTAQPGSDDVRAVASPDEARRAVEGLACRGTPPPAGCRPVDFIKVLATPDAATYRAILAAAAEASLPVVGHVPGMVDVATASALGQRSIEHLTGIVAATSGAGPAAAESLAVAIRARDRRRYDAARTQLLASYDSSGATRLYRALAARGTAQAPTLATFRRDALLADARRGDATALARLGEARTAPGIPAALLGEWPPLPVADGATPAGAASAGTASIERATLTRALRIVGDMWRAGVPILAGTDAIDPYVAPGTSLHDELALLVEAGLPPAAALRAATIDAARFLGVADSLGAVREGARADLVLLDADPLADVANSRRIRAVLVDGRLVEPARPR